MTSYIRQKTSLILVFLGLTSYLLCACGKETPLLTVEDYKLDAESGSTSRGVRIGDDAGAFQAAYQDYMIFSATADTTQYQFLPVDEIPYDTALTLIIPTFFIDGLPIDTAQFCEENEIEQTDLISYLTAESYLANHKVVYRYLVFTWENGVITDIRTESMDYNQDASYYEAN